MSGFIYNSFRISQSLVFHATKQKNLYEKISQIELFSRCPVRTYIVHVLLLALRKPDTKKARLESTVQVKIEIKNEIAEASSRCGKSARLYQLAKPKASVSEIIRATSIDPDFRT